jgi:hypothetical protein
MKTKDQQLLEEAYSSISNNSPKYFLIDLYTHVPEAIPQEEFALAQKGLKKNISKDGKVVVYSGEEYLAVQIV